MNAGGKLAPWGLALLVWSFLVFTFWPGYLSWDSAYQWWQARHDQFDSVHPPLLAMFWQVFDRLGWAPGGVLAAQLLLLWSALAGFVCALPRPAWWRCAALLLLGLWPPLLGLSPHLWKDLWTLGFFAWAVALLAHDAHHPQRLLRLMALLALILACAFRHNAITGALPLLLWLAWREGVAWRGPRVRTLPVLVGGGALCVLVWFAAALPLRDARVRPVERVWSVVTLWDAAGVSLREHRLVYPPQLIDPSLTLDELRTHFVDYANPPLFAVGKLRHSFDAPYTPEQRAALDHLAWQLPTQHTAAYLRHRLRLSALLFGWDRAGQPDHLVLAPRIEPYGDNPALAPRRPAWEAPFWRAMLAAIDTPLYAGWLYLLLCAAVAVAGLRRRDVPPAQLAATAALSALAYALPFALLSGSAEFRYLAWPVLACGMSALLLLVSPRRRR